MFTLTIFISAFFLVVGVSGVCVSYGSYGDRQNWGRAFWVLNFISVTMLTWGIINFVNKGDYIRAELSKNPNVIMVESSSKKIPDETLRLMPKFQVKTIVVDDGMNITYWEIVK